MSGETKDGATDRTGTTRTTGITRTTVGSNPTAWNLIAQVRARQPIIHCITNYVTANDVANIILAVGASPIMADGAKEAEDITAISHGLVLNLGTLKENSIEAMLLAGQRAAELEHPIVLDPVGAGASAYRRETALRILSEIPCTVIRGNASEIRALAQEKKKNCFSRGVDADSRESLTEDNCREMSAMVQELSRQTNAVVVMTGATDLVADSERVCLINNGSPMMSRITGAGCMLDGVLAAVLSASGMCVLPTPGMGVPSVSAINVATPGNGTDNGKPDTFWQTVWAVAAVGICGEIAGGINSQPGSVGGTGSFRMHFLDVMSRLTDADVRNRIQFVEVKKDGF